jgi:hypothetical protein
MVTGTSAEALVLSGMALPFESRCGLSGTGKSSFSYCGQQPSTSRSCTSRCGGVVMARRRICFQARTDHAHATGVPVAAGGGPRCTVVYFQLTGALEPVGARRRRSGRRRRQREHRRGPASRARRPLERCWRMPGRWPRVFTSPRSPATQRSSSGSVCGKGGSIPKCSSGARGGGLGNPHTLAEDRADDPARTSGRGSIGLTTGDGKRLGNQLRECDRVRWGRLDAPR